MILPNIVRARCWGTGFYTTRTPAYACSWGPVDRRERGERDVRGIQVSFVCGDLSVKSGEKTSTCPYCGSSVLVPDELLDKTQIGPTVIIEAGKTARSATGCALVSVALGVLTIGAVAAFFISSLDSDGEIPVPDRGAESLLRFGAEGTGHGYFTDPRHIAVDGDGCIYVADYTTGRIQAFDGEGGFLRQWRVESVNDDVYITSMDASQEGTVYVTETGRILSYDGSTGEPLGQLADIDGFSDVFVTEDGEVLATMWSCGDRICRFTPDGTLELDITGAVDEAAGGSELDPLVASDGTGDIFVFGVFTSRVFRFDSDGVFRDMFGSSGTEPGQFTAPSDIAIDGRGYIYIPDSGGIISVFDTSGTFLGRIDLPFYDYVYGMDVGPDGNLYLVTGGFEVVVIPPYSG